MSKIIPCKYDIRFEGVGFAYLKGIPVLEDINFYIPEKTRLVLFGPAGSGKTTIMALIARLWDVHTGIVKIGGTDVKNIHPQTIFHLVNEVFRDVPIFDDSIYNNIRFGRSNATETEVLDAADKAMVLDFAWELPKGLHTRVGKGGGRLSIREKQCIGIARALLNNAPIVLLDETAACMDLEKEPHLHKAIKELTKNKTVVIATSRLAPWQEADKIMDLQQARRPLILSANSSPD
jgi:ATP-binding cassette subfamily B protein